MRHLSFLIILLSLFIPGQLFSQSTEFFHGKIFDAVTKEPLPFASIILQEAKIGVFSNAEGDFKIANKGSFLSDSLIISFIGYKNYSVPLKGLKQNGINTVFLTPISINLKEVNIVKSAKKLDSKSIIRHAIKNIPVNYSAIPSNYISYYRDYQKREKKYYNLNEAIVQTLDSGIPITSRENKYWLLDFKQNKDFPRFELPANYDSLVSSEENANKFIKYGSLPDHGGNELFILMGHDPIRNYKSQTFSFVDIFSQNFISNHHFLEPVPIYENNLMLYKIDFSAKPYLTGDSLVISGTVYIQPINYAIHKLAYSASYLLKGGRQKKMFDITIEYGCSNTEDPRMRLKYISFNNIFDVADKKDTSCFRIIGTKITPAPQLTTEVELEFNHIPDTKIASNNESYKIYLKEKMVKAQNIKVLGKKVILIVKDEGMLDPQLTVLPKELKDINGNPINKKKTMEFYQFRELFVQDFNKPVSFNESSCLKDLPLEKGLISSNSGIQNYWMNSPIVTDSLQVDTAPGFKVSKTDYEEKEKPTEAINGEMPHGLADQGTMKNTPGAEKINLPINKYMDNIEKKYGSDQVFVQLDKSTYYPGDTIYFQAYIRDRFTGNFQTKSIAFYALLCDNQKTVIDSARFKINNSTCTGWMAIPDQAETGKYHFTAFSGMMQNYDPEDAFHLDILVKGPVVKRNKIEVSFNKKDYAPKDTILAFIRITDATGKPVGKQKIKCNLSFDSSDQESYETQTNDTGFAPVRFSLPDSILSQPFIHVVSGNGQKKDGATIVKEVNIPCQADEITLSFLPEGGTFIEGLSQKVGFNATNGNGKSEPVMGLLKEPSGIIVDTIKSGIYGPGVFTCFAKPGLYVELIKGYGSGRIFPLPAPESKGFALVVDRAGKSAFAIEIQSNNYNGEAVTVSCILNNNLVLNHELMMNKRQRLVVKTDELPAGVAQIILFDSHMRPAAQRLIYVNAEKRLNYSIKLDSILTTNDETQLIISATDDQGKPSEGIFSIAVTDSINNDSSEILTPGIEYTFNFHPFLLKNLPLTVLKKGIENIPEADRDLMLMVFGYSHFNQDFVSQNISEKKPFDFESLKMKVLYSTKTHRAERILNLVSLEGPSIKKLITNKMGETILPLDSLPEITRTVTLMPVVNDKKSARGAMLSIPYNEQYFKNSRLFSSQQNGPSFNHQEQQDVMSNLSETTFEIPEVIIKAHPKVKKVYHDQYEEQYQSGNIKSIDPEMIWSSASLENAIRKRVNIFQLTNDYLILRPSRSFFGKTVPALFVLDGQPLYANGWEIAKTISLTEIASLTVLNGPQGVTQFGEAAQSGVIFITTLIKNPDVLKIKTKWIKQNSKDQILEPIELYRSYVEFYNPAKLKNGLDLQPENPRTIYWNPEIYCNGKDPVTIKYKNPINKNPVSIIINGISYNNLIGSKILSPLTK